MKKIFFLLSMFFAFGVSTQAVPVRPGMKKVLTLADGTAVTAELKGDEYMSWWETTDGAKYVQSTANEKTFVAANLNTMKAQSAERRAVINAARAKRMASALVPTKSTLGGDHITYSGKKKGIIVLVNFTDSKFADGHDKEYYEKVMNTPNFTSDEGYVGSVRDYFYAQSNGTFELDFDVFGPIELAHAYAWYGKDNSSSDRDVRVGKMIKEAVEGADAAGANWKDYDWDGDGECDQVFVLYAGLGQASGGDDNTIWPHEYKMSACAELNRKSVTTASGIIVDTYACSNEQQPVLESGQFTNNYQPAGIGTICHEFSHCLGFPDTYDTSSQGNYAMGTWDPMATGSYNGTNSNGMCPANFTAWERIYAGWVEPIELDKSATIKSMASSANYGRPFIIYNDANENEYYLLENRQKSGWDASLYGEGLLISHIDYDATAWASNIVNYYSDHQRMTIFHADNEDASTYTSSIEADPYPYKAGNRIFNDKLTDESEPAATLFNNNADGRKYMGKPITTIRSRTDGTVSFAFMGGDSDNVIDNSTTGIGSVTVSGTVNHDGVYAIDGRYLGSSLAPLGKGIYIVGGKKVVK
jgi:immune inhibitor A